MMRLVAIALVGAACSSPAKSAPPKTVEPAVAPAPQKKTEELLAKARDEGLLDDKPKNAITTTDKPEGFDNKVTVGALGTAGDLDKAIIRRYVKAKLPEITACFEKELAGRPTLAGSVNIQFLIKPDGAVDGATGTGLPPVDACVAEVIAKIVFPAPKGGGNVQVNYPFVFRP